MADDIGGGMTLPDNVSFENRHPSQGDVQEELLHGLRQSQKVIHPKYFYDQCGSELFDAITQLSEYYLTRTERHILETNRAEIAACCGIDPVVIEPGSGNCEKVRLLLNDIRPSAYVPIDISAAFLQDSAIQLGREYPWLRVHAICADAQSDLDLSVALPRGRKTIFYPGSSIGNLDPNAAVEYLRQLGGWLDGGGGILIGVDLHKASSTLEAAYNDKMGITAEFNLNLLHRVNAELQAEFDINQFAHRAFYDAGKQRIEMHLVSATAQRVRCNGEVLVFEAGESIHTENSYKYTVTGFAEMVEQAGFSVHQSWIDENELFSVHYLTPIGS